MKTCIKNILNGFDVIYAKRKNRDGETYIKKFISKLGYRLINFFSDIEIPPDVGDFRIISKRVANQISNFQERESYLRGLVSYIGFKQDYVEFSRDRRFSGEGKYNKFLGSIKIGLNGLRNYLKTFTNNGYFRFYILFF